MHNPASLGNQFFFFCSIGKMTSYNRAAFQVHDHGQWCSFLDIIWYIDSEGSFKMFLWVNFNLYQLKEPPAFLIYVDCLLTQHPVTSDTIHLPLNPLKLQLWDMNPQVPTEGNRHNCQVHTFPDHVCIFHSSKTPVLMLFSPSSNKPLDKNGIKTGRMAHHYPVLNNVLMRQF